jgi:hypothetical protein
VAFKDDERRAVGLRHDDQLRLRQVEEHAVLLDRRSSDLSSPDLVRCDFRPSRVVRDLQPPFPVDVEDLEHLLRSERRAMPADPLRKAPEEPDPLLETRYSSRSPLRYRLAAESVRFGRVRMSTSRPSRSSSFRSTSP